MNENLRPGVYARYHIAGGRAPGREAALILAGEGEPLTLKSCPSPGDGFDAKALACLRLLFAGGAQTVRYLPAADPAQALALLEGSGVNAVVWGLGEGLAALSDFLRREGEEGREGVAFVGANDPQAALDAAALLDSERVAVCCPALSPGGELEPDALYAACALAGAVAGIKSPASPLEGLEFPGLEVTEALPEAEVQRLLAGGVSPFEGMGDGVSLIRALTTRQGDGSLRSLEAVLTADHVLQTLRRELEGLLAGAGLSAAGVGDAVAVHLAAKTQEGILTGFDPPVVRREKNDPGACVVEVSFGVARLLSRIKLTAHVRA